MQNHIYKKADEKQHGKLVIRTADASILVVMEHVVAFFNKSFLGVFKKMPRIVSAIIAVVVLCIGCLFVFSATQTVSAVQVSLDDDSVRFVKDNSVVAEAQVLAVKAVSNSECNIYLATPKTDSCITSQSSLIEAQELSNAIIENSTNITKTSFLYIDDKRVAKSESCDTINTSLNNYLTKYKASTGSDSIDISSRVNIKEEYAVVTDINTLPEVESFFQNNMDAVPVEETYTVVNNRDIPFKTTEIKTDKLYVGSTKTVITGVLGVEEVTYRVSVADDGTKTQTELSSKTIKEPINAKVYVGTKKVYSSDKNGSAPMIWPVKRVAGSYVSSYMGDGRGHKGFDIAAPSGTDIYAAFSGTVSFAGVSSGYGNCIIIDHGNSLETVYAHCNSLFVSKGDTVSVGELIAAVGCTGNATGNHLHFEVRVNGTAVNPVQYIGYN